MFLSFCCWSLAHSMMGTDTATFLSFQSLLGDPLVISHDGTVPPAPGSWKTVVAPATAQRHSAYVLSVA